MQMGTLFEQERYCAKSGDNQAFLHSCNMVEKAA